MAPSKEKVKCIMSSGNLRMIEKAIKHKWVDVNLPDTNGETPLHWACRKGHLPPSQMLIEKGAALNRPDNYGRTPFYWACGKGHLPVAQLLAEKGADLNFPDNDGQTPLYGACWKGHLLIAQWLVEKGADLNLPDNYGMTPLNAACWNGHMHVAQWLVEKGALVQMSHIKLEKSLWPIFLSQQKILTMLAIREFFPDSLLGILPLDMFKLLCREVVDQEEDAWFFARE